jgi:hypothetical protein
MDDFIHGRHEGKQKVLQVAWSSSKLLALWHMQTENSGIENLENNNINHGDVLLHGIMFLFCREGKMRLGACNLMQMKKISVLKLTKQRHES